MGGGWIPAYAGKTEVGQGSVMRNEIPRGPRNDGRVSCKKGDSGRQGSRGGRMGSRLRLHGGRLFAGKTSERAGIRVGGRDSATPLRCAPNDMWGGGSGMGPRPPSSRGQDLDARTTGGSGRFANKPLPDGCQTGRRDGSPPPVFTGAGSRREDNGGERAVREQAPTRWLSDGWEGWVPAPRLYGGRISTRGQRGEGERAVREQAPTRWLSDGWEGWVPAPRLHGGRISTRGQRGGGGLGLEVGDDGFEGLYGLVYVSVGVGQGWVELLGALEDSLLLDEVAEAGLDCVVGG